MPSRNLERAVELLASSRKNLATQAANPEADSERLSSYLTQVAVYEGEVRAWTLLTTVWERTDEQVEADRIAKMADAVANLLTSCNKVDTWSGRGNEVNRAYNDGMRDVARVVAIDGFRIVS